MVKRVSPLEPTGPGNRLVYWMFQHFLFHGLFRGIYSMSVADMRALPDGPVILACNHRSFLDPLVLGAAVDRRVTYMMKAKYYDIPAINWFFRMARCIVVEAEGGDRRNVMREAVAVLREGGVLGMFPEGHISDDGFMGPVEPGLAMIARRSGAPVIPVHLGGTREALQKGDKFLHLSRMTARMGEPMSIADYPDGREGADAFMSDCMGAIAAMGARSAERIGDAAGVRLPV
ncbi:MAG: lysophospholipid acyltransferase family protein [Planctomycetota bacterium]|jgi:1-acyl-sn-glycerol-3-phosphate acyltransferase